MRLGFVVSMYDENRCVTDNLKRLGDQFERIAVVQSQLQPYPDVEVEIDRIGGDYILFENLDNRTEEEKAANAERFDIGARSMSRNFSAGFDRMRTATGQLLVDYVVAVTGDTLFLHLFGVEYVIGRMKETAGQIGCARAMGQNLHAAHWTREQMADKSLRKEGRYQDESVKDFMPQFFVARSDMIPRLSNITVTNPWCMEQCLGDAIGDAKQFVFAKQAYAFADGVIYNTPSPTNWKHA